MVRITFAALLSLVTFAPAATAICSCQCMNGEPRTLCTDFAEARSQRDLCGRPPHRLACAPAPEAVEAPLDAPIEGAHGCRTTTLWDPNAGAYATPVRVCETVTPASPDTDSRRRVN